MTRTHLVSLALGLAMLTVRPDVAHAGGCSPCTTSAECVALFGAPAFCIQWDDPTGGCVGTPIQCCPGQGCSALSGRPSCESDGRCHVVDEDAGVSLPDTGMAGTDAGSSGTDAGGTGADAASTGMDAGTTGGSARGGCACRVGRGAPATGAWSVLALVLAAIFVRRRR